MLPRRGVSLADIQHSGRVESRLALPSDERQARESVTWEMSAEGNIEAGNDALLRCGTNGIAPPCQRRMRFRLCMKGFGQDRTAQKCTRCFGRHCGMLDWQVRETEEE